MTDPGLQSPRTALAWRRSSLAIIVGSTVALRLLPPVLGQWSIGVGVVGLLAASGLWAASGVRARRVQKAVAAGTPLPGGLLIALLAATTAATAAVSLALSLVLEQ